MAKARLPPLLKWPGGKARLAAKLEQLMPEHDTYVEPFVGGGSTFFRKEEVELSVLGDKDPFPIEFFHQVRTGGLRKCRGGMKPSRSLFDRSKKGKSACMRMALSTLSYHGDRATYGAKSSEGKVVGRNKMRNLKAYEKKLRKAHLVVGDFDEVMKRFDKPSAVHFLDPPWPLDSGYSDTKYHLGRQKKMGKAYDPAYVRDTCNKMKGACLVIYGDHPSVREAFKKAQKQGCWKVYSHRVSTNRGDGGMEKRVNIIALKSAGCSPGGSKKKASTKRRHRTKRRGR